MAQFITGKDLEKAVYDIIWDAKQTLLIVSPYIKLDDYFKTLFDHHANNPQLHIILVFGKNEKAVSKSLSKTDFDFFKKFLNVSIVYIPTLHGKYYANEMMGLLTSINLYDYSFKNNIEFGMLSKGSILNRFTTTADDDNYATCENLAYENDVVFIKRPVFQKNLLSSILGKKYIKSDVLYDATENFYSLYKKVPSASKRIDDFPSEIGLGSENSSRPEREEVENQNGYCIRTGVQIKYNPAVPYSALPYKSWAQFKNNHYPEKYCHKTGKLSKGKTSMQNPIL